MRVLRKIAQSFFALFTLAAATGLGSLAIRPFGLGITETAILSAIVGIFVLFFIFSIGTFFFRRSKMHAMRDVHNELTYALNEIANGNFNVFVSVNPRLPHHELGEALNEMTRKLGNMEQMRSDFISNVSHEFQSPLTSIGGFAALLKKEHNPHYAEIIVQEAKRLSTLSDNLLKLSSLEKKPLEKSEYRLDKQLQSVILMLEPQWSGKQINIEIDMRKTTVNADENLMSQVWINLLQNAVKFTKDTISITLKDSEVSISDNGCGISDDDKPHIFERFYKVDKARDRSLGGNGLGLSIVKKILELHGFDIKTDSEPGHGTKFTVRLPTV